MIKSKTAVVHEFIANIQIVSTLLQDVLLSGKYECKKGYTADLFSVDEHD